MRGSRFRAIALGTLVILVLPGCAEVSQNPKDPRLAHWAAAAGGGLIAGAAGAWCGNRGRRHRGGLLGGLVGNVLERTGSSLVARRPSGLETTASGKSVPWNNPTLGMPARSHRSTPTRLRMVHTAGIRDDRSRSTTGRSEATGGHAGSRTAAGRLLNDHAFATAFTGRKAA